jgi:hypothetical protein
MASNPHYHHDKIMADIGESPRSQTVRRVLARHAVRAAPRSAGFQAFAQ